jgi:hypothetical protein
MVKKTDEDSNQEPKFTGKAIFRNSLANVTNIRYAKGTIRSKIILRRS